MGVSVRNALTIDVEDYFQVSAFEDSVSRDQWSSIEPRVERNTQRLLAIFAEQDAQATFFVLGWVAKRFPGLIRQMVAEGHEVASHGMLHQRASSQTKAEFRQDVKDSKSLLEDITGKEILGYRAPSFSFTKENLWVYDILRDEGYLYSSSVYPVVHDHYGIPDAPRFRYQPIEGIDEIPLSTLSFFGKNIPISGGGYFRLYPYWLTRWAMKRFSQENEKPYIFYLHPWEVDPHQPRMSDLSVKTRFRHYLNLEKVESRIQAMLREFEWASMAQLYEYEPGSVLQSESQGDKKEGDGGCIGVVAGS